MKYIEIARLVFDFFKSACWKAFITPLVRLLRQLVKDK